VGSKLGIDYIVFLSFFPIELDILNHHGVKSHSSPFKT